MWRNLLIIIIKGKSQETMTNAFFYTFVFIYRSLYYQYINIRLVLTFSWIFTCCCLYFSSGCQFFIVFSYIIIIINFIIVLLLLFVYWFNVKISVYVALSFPRMNEIMISECKTSSSAVVSRKKEITHTSYTCNLLLD